MNKHIDHPMKISVILMAYNRQSFIKEALSSIIEQTLDRCFFEVIVIKNFWNYDVDKILEFEGFQNIVIDKPMPAPEMLSTAIDHARNEIISFLDDDDLFDKGKLERTFNLFNKSKDVVFHHSGVSVFTTQGSRYHNDRNLKIVPDKPLYLKGPYYDTRIIYYNAGFSLSSMSILRDSIDMHYFRSLITNPDMFMLFSAMKTAKTIIIDNEALTFYRVHGDNVSINISRENVIKFNEKYFRTYYQIDEMIYGYKKLQKYLKIYMLPALLDFHISKRERSKVLMMDMPIFVCLWAPYVLRRDPKSLPVRLAKFVSPTIRSIFLRFFNTE